MRLHPSRPLKLVLMLPVVVLAGACTQIGPGTAFSQQAPPTTADTAGTAAAHGRSAARGGLRSCAAQAGRRLDLVMCMYMS